MKTQLALAATENRVSLESSEAKCQLRIEEAKQTARRQLEAQANRYEFDSERLHTRLRDLATINVDLACEMPEMKAQITELQLENARLIHNWRADAQELIQVAGRLFELSSRLGLPLDKPTKEIFQRRGWRTNGKFSLMVRAVRAHEAMRLTVHEVTRFSVHDVARLHTTYPD